MLQTTLYTAASLALNDNNQPQLSLEDKILHAYANTLVEDYNKVSALQRDVNDPDVYSNPESLLRVQNEFSKRNVEINVISVMVKKGITTADTVIRA